MIPFPVSQRALRGKRFRLLDGRMDGASLFPFFDSSGIVRRLMLTRLDSGDILLLDWRPALLLRRPFLAKRVALTRDAGAVATAETAAALSELWHFDPWWELAAARYDGQPVVPHIKRTNLPGFDGTIRHVWFDAALSRVTHVSIGDEEESIPRRFSPDMLQAAHERRLATAPPLDLSTAAERTGWRLRPFWS